MDDDAVPLRFLLEGYEGLCQRLMVTSDLTARSPLAAAPRLFAGLAKRQREAAAARVLLGIGDDPQEPGWPSQAERDHSSRRRRRPFPLPHDADSAWKAFLAVESEPALRSPAGSRPQHPYSPNNEALRHEAAKRQMAERVHVQETWLRGASRERKAYARLKTRAVRRGAAAHKAAMLALRVEYGQRLSEGGGNPPMEGGGGAGSSGSSGSAPVTTRRLKEGQHGPAASAVAVRPASVPAPPPASFVLQNRDEKLARAAHVLAMRGQETEKVRALVAARRNARGARRAFPGAEAGCQQQVPHAHNAAPMQTVDAASVPGPWAAAVALERDAERETSAPEGRVFVASKGLCAHSTSSKAVLAAGFRRRWTAAALKANQSPNSARRKPELSLAPLEASTGSSWAPKREPLGAQARRQRLKAEAAAALPALAGVKAFMAPNAAARAPMNGTEAGCSQAFASGAPVSEFASTWGFGTMSDEGSSTVSIVSVGGARSPVAHAPLPPMGFVEDNLSLGLENAVEL